MSTYQSIKNVSKRALMVGGLVAALSGCDEGSIFLIKGTVKSEQRGEGWYQVSLVNHNMNTLRYGDTVEIRFYSNNFDLDQIDERINTRKKLAVVGTEVSGGREVDYEWKADAIDKIE